MTLPALIAELARAKLTAFPSLTAARLAAQLVRECRTPTDDAAEVAEATGEKEVAVGQYRGGRKGRARRSKVTTPTQKAS